MLTAPTFVFLSFAQPGSIKQLAVKSKVRAVARYKAVLTAILTEILMRSFLVDCHQLN